jgi:hypothetical protein
MSGQRAPSRFQDACVHVVGGTSPRVRACVQLPSEMVVRRHSGHALSSVGRKRQFLATCLVAGSTVSRQCEPRSRGCLVARSNRPHRQPSHRRGRKLATIAPCGSGTASLRWRRSRSYWDAHQKRGGGTSRRVHEQRIAPAVSTRPPPVRSSVPTDRWNTRHSREGEGMRSYFYHVGISRHHRQNRL